jgi:hypothetical protein
MQVRATGCLLLRLRMRSVGNESACGGASITDSRRPIPSRSRIPGFVPYRADRSVDRGSSYGFAACLCSTRRSLRTVCHRAGNAFDVSGCRCGGLPLQVLDAIAPGHFLHSCHALLPRDKAGTRAGHTNLRHRVSARLSVAAYGGSPTHPHRTSASALILSTTRSR